MALSRINNPFLSSSGAGNASITSPAANTVAFTTATTERMRIDSSGNVGIGTSSPSDKLTVISAGTQVGSTNFRNIARIGLATNDASVLLGYDVSAGSAILASTNNYPIAFWTSIAGTYAEKMRIDSSGNVGIGTSSPTGKLNVVTNNSHDGGATFDSTGTTQVWMRDTDATVNTRNWGLQISGGDFNILRANDDRATGFVTPVSFNQAPANSLLINSAGLITILGQIKFPATQNASADANTLDDYEEGTWTPVFSASGLVYTQGATLGKYVKVGRIVTFTASIQWSGKSAGTGNLTITLPFTSSNDTGAWQGLFTVGYHSGINVLTRTGYCDPASGTFSFVRSDSATTIITAADMASGGHIIFGGSFQV